MPDRHLQFFEQVAALKREGQSFALAMVVARRSPVSSHLGDHAVIFADGRMQGFVGGACSREIVRKQGLEALTLGSPRLVQIRPEGIPAGFAANANHVVAPMSCASEGAVDIYIEPYPRPFTLLLVGFSPVAEMLAHLALGLEYEVAWVVTDEESRDIERAVARTVRLDDLPAYLANLPAADLPRLAALVASQGHYDEEALEALLPVRPRYVGLLASRKRGDSVKEALRDRGIAEADLATIRNPVGLDLGATSPGEVAVSILAEIIQAKAAAAPLDLVEQQQAAAEHGSIHIDPVCGMEVEVAGAHHRSEFEGRVYLFCCPHCKAGFDREPARYLTPARAT
ncbi:MAG TPA: XdhC family protein [Chloroflexota bacterium]|nr:XdhC family protein [Chloroflexota bacterium]